MTTESKIFCECCDGSARPLFMVHNKLWNANARSKAILCRGCFKEQLGRKLTVDDLMGVPLNLDLWKEGLGTREELLAKTMDNIAAAARDDRYSFALERLMCTCRELPGFVQQLIDRVELNK